MASKHSARDEHSVASLYEDTEVAETYIQKRFYYPWSRLLHETQVAAVNSVLHTYAPQNILELAPGPARIATELKGVHQGIMLENSAAMLTQARQRLTAAGLAEVWQLQQGNAFELGHLQGQFQFLYTFRFIRHFQHDERTRLYKGMAACLQPEGLLMFDVVNQVVRHKIDAQRPAQTSGELDVYDETYTPETFRQEMADHGFTVLHLMPVITHFSLQSWLSYRLTHRLPMVSNLLVRLLEKVPSTQPLEWITLCRKTH